MSNNLHPLRTAWINTKAVNSNNIQMDEGEASHCPTATQVCMM